MKSRPDFLPPKALLLAGEVMALNEEKHPNQRWKTITPEEHVGAVLRHILKWLSGEKLDPETGRSHLQHAMCRNAMAVEVEASTQRKNPLDFTPEEAAEFYKEARKQKWAWLDRVRYTHVEEAPLPSPVQPEYEAWLDGKLKYDEFVEDPCPGEPVAEVRAKVGDWIEITMGEGGASVGSTVEVVKVESTMLGYKYKDTTYWAGHGCYKIIPPPTSQSKTPEQGIDSIKPAQWDNMNREFLDSHMNDLYRYAAATDNQKKGDEE